MKLRLTLTAVLLSLLSSSIAQPVVVGAGIKAPHSFAIVIDNLSYQACQADLMAYKASIENSGLSTYIFADDWQSPEQVKSILTDYYQHKGLDGAVFIGKVPIAMVRRAQHMTSAFKMDQSSDFFNTSVPSDRFYDDFDLAFDFLSKQDTLGHSFFYYNLSGKGAQEICCDIYSARIKPSLDGEEGYQQLRDYLQKVVAQKKLTNTLNTVVSYTGEGSFSNSLAAWKDETITLREQMPDAFHKADDAKFYIYAMYPFVKDVLLSEIQRKDLDLILFHEHGVPDRQYISGEPSIDSDPEAFFEDARRKARQAVKQRMRYGDDKALAIQKISQEYDLDSAWFADFDDPAVRAADSLYDLKTGIILDDIRKAKPNTKIALFDACYNGDFREKDCVASSYILSGGDALIGLGNSVNVLQDKSSSDLLGLLAMGYRVGEVMQLTNILESHIHGDPTFAFASSFDLERADLHNTQTDYWLSYLDQKYPCDMQGLALYKLFNLRYEGLSDLLFKTFSQSPYYMLRLQCMHLAAHYADGTYAKILRLALDDPYEYIRRKGANYIAALGDTSDIPALVDLYLSDYMSERVLFNIWFAVGYYRDEAVHNALEKAINESDFIFDKEAFAQEQLANVDRFGNTPKAVYRAMFGEKASPRVARFYINSLRNDPCPYMVDDILKTIKNPATETSYRISLIEALGWYKRCPRKGDIIAVCQELLANENTLDAGVVDELHKTINRLKEYTR